MAVVTCARCGKTESEESKGFVNWEALGPDGAEAICPACITPAEEDAALRTTLDIERNIARGQSPAGFHHPDGEDVAAPEVER